MPFQGVLMVESKLFRVLMYMHFGGEKPVVYKSAQLKGCMNLGVLHLQCLSGVHCNWVIEKKSYKRRYE